MKYKCVKCGQPIADTGKIRFSFCSERCRMIDLGDWLNEEHKIPAGPADTGFIESNQGDTKH